ERTGRRRSAARAEARARALSGSGAKGTEAMAEDLSGLRKSAIVLLSLGEQHAAEVLRRLDEHTADAVRDEMRRVGELRRVSLHTRQYVLGQFCTAATTPPLLPPPPLPTDDDDVD